MSIEKLPETKRISIVTGHYGSGKTEFSVSLVMALAEAGIYPLSIVDLDIVNPYFRSRERRDVLEAAGIGVHGSVYREEITAELPALGAALRAPLEDPQMRTIVDAGGNDSGAMVLNQFAKYFTPDQTSVMAVVNFSRYETRTIETAAEHINAIECVTGLKVEFIVNNTHLLRETTAETILRGHAMSLQLCQSLGTQLYCDCYPVGVVRPEDLHEIDSTLFPLELYMRPTYLDK